MATPFSKGGKKREVEDLFELDTMDELFEELDARDYMDFDELD